MFWSQGPCVRADSAKVRNRSEERRKTSPDNTTAIRSVAATPGGEVGIAPSVAARKDRLGASIFRPRIRLFTIPHGRLDVSAARKNGFGALALSPRFLVVTSVVGIFGQCSHVNAPGSRDASRYTVGAGVEEPFCFGR